MINVIILDMDQLNNLNLSELKEKWNFYLEFFYRKKKLDFLYPVNNLIACIL